MAKVGVKRATELTGVSKSTIQRDMKKGKVSFTTENGRKTIDVSELERVYGFNNGSMGSSETLEAKSYEVELEKAKQTLELDRLEMKIKMLESQLDAAHEQIDDIKAQRDSWQQQANLTALTYQKSQEQAEDRITELQKREEERLKAIQLRRQKELQRQKALAASNQNIRQSNSIFRALFTKPRKAAGDQ